ncbi:MAG: TraB/GumN family protein [Candidatus Kapabacteria bacterium]|jgi:uncharacterized protein YbaP (TraB family)|nr:TraB/GumN family protein [Candidatus Kapabacteria bacterium]
MKKYRILLLLFIIFISCSSVKDNAKPSTLMWEISSAGGKGKVFVLGSIHLADERIYPLNPAIEKAFINSDALVLEILVDEIDPMSIMQYLSFMDERTLESELPPDVYEKIAEMFKKNGIPKQIYNKFKPWFAALTLQSDAFKSAGFSSAEGVDMHFLKKARAKDMDVLEIESLEIQMNLMDELGAFTGDFLKSVLEETDSAGESVDELIEAWKNGDADEIERLTNKGNETKEFAEVMEKLNYQRNVKMVEKIEEYLKSDKTYFVVVGAAHVVGKRGIAGLLENNNKYIIKRY